MAPLSVHESKSSNHDRLGFHPDCPVCGRIGCSECSRRIPSSLVASGPAGDRCPRVLAQASPRPRSRLSQTTNRRASCSPSRAPRCQSRGDDLGRDSGGETALPFEVTPGRRRLSAGSDGQKDSEDTAAARGRAVDDPDGRLSLTRSGRRRTASTRKTTPVPPTEVAPPVRPHLRRNRRLIRTATPSPRTVAPPADQARPARAADRSTGAQGATGTQARKTPRRHNPAGPRASAGRGLHTGPPSSTNEEAVDTPATTSAAPLEDRHVHVVRPGRVALVDCLAAAGRRRVCGRDRASRFAGSGDSTRNGSAPAIRMC